MNAIRKIFFKDPVIKTFLITRLKQSQVEETVFLKRGGVYIDITGHHSMICLDPFCVAVWLSDNEAAVSGIENVKLQFKKGNRLNASLAVSLIEKIKTAKGILLLYKIEKANNYQLNPLYRFLFFAWLVRSKKNTYYSRKVISALYSYPRNIIIVSYSDDEYCNIFPMDIQGYIPEEDMYLLGLRTTNVTLNKILEAKKVVVCDTDSVELDTVYNLGKHSSKAPTPKDALPFCVTESEVFGFPVPDFTGSYKEIEIIQHKKMGYHMLMIGKVVNAKQLKKEPASLYHVGFLQFKNSSYAPIEGLF
jgi:hypothetical protein